MTRRIKNQWRRFVRSLVTLFVYDVFISYARRDGRRYARRLHRLLEGAGLITYLDTGDLFAGERLDPALGRALRKSRILVLVATTGARASQHVAREVETYLQTGRPIVPLDFEGSYANADWPRLSALGVIWLSESPDALISGGPSRQVTADIRRHLKASGSRVIVKRVMALVLLLVAALIVGVWWSSAVAAKQGRQRDAQQLTARAQLAIDMDQNGLLALAYGVEALQRHDTIEAADLIGRVLPYTRKPLRGAKPGRLIQRVWFSASGRYVIAVMRLDVPSDAVVALTADDLKERLRIERRTILAVAMSPDERYLAVADGGGCAPVFDPLTARTMTCLPQAGVHRIEFSRDGHLVATAGAAPGTGPEGVAAVRLWTSAWHPGPVLHVATRVHSLRFSPDGTRLAVGFHGRGPGDAPACLWDFASGDACRPVGSLPDGAQRQQTFYEQSNVQFSRDGERLLIANSIRATVIDLASPDMAEQTIERGSLTSAELDPAGVAVLTTTSDGLATLSSLRSASDSFIAHLPHPDRVLQGHFSADGRRVITVCADGIVRIWEAGVAVENQNDFFQSNRLSGLITHGPNMTSWMRNRAQQISSVAIAANSASLVTGGHDGWVRIWRLDAEADVGGGRHGQWIGGVADGPAPNTFVTASEYYGRVWALNPLRELRQLKRHDNDISGVAITGDRRLVATAGSDGAVHVFDGASYQLLQTIFHNPESEITPPIAFDRDGTVLLTGGTDGFVRIWEPRTGRLITKLPHPKPVSAVAVSPAGNIAVVGSEDATGRFAAVWDISEEPRQRFRLESASRIEVLRFNHRGTRLASGAEDGAATIWNADTGRAVRVMEHLDRITAAAFTPNDEFLATGSHDRTVRVWDAARGIEVARLTRAFRVEAIDFTSGGRMLIAAGENYVQISPWRSVDLRKVACDVLGGVLGAEWMPLFGRGVGSNVCATESMAAAVK